VLGDEAERRTRVQWMDSLRISQSSMYDRTQPTDPRTGGHIDTNERAEVAAQFIGSLEPPPDPHLDTLWEEEISRHLAGFEAGRTARERRSNCDDQPARGTTWDRIPSKTEP
jgi:hypothetical protein